MKIVQLSNGSSPYYHYLTEANEEERDAIFGSKDDDYIMGDNEIWFDYTSGPGILIYDYDLEQFIGPPVPGEPSFYLHSPPTAGELEEHSNLAAWYPDDDPSRAYILDEFINAGAGNDIVFGRDGNDWIIGGEGNDTLFGGSDDDIVQGGDGDDYVSGGFGRNHLEGGSGDDYLHVSIPGNNSFIDGGDGFDTVHIEQMSANAFNFSLRDEVGLYHIGDGEIITVKQVEALIFDGSTGDGNYNISGGIERDELMGGNGRDTLHGESGDDYIHGGAADDELHGGAGDDSIMGGDGDDTIYDDEGDDAVGGGAGNDFILTGVGNDVVHAGTGNDVVVEIDEDNTRQRDTVNDIIYGEEGDDLLSAGYGFDCIFGGADNDTIVGGAHADTLTGGGGRDTFSYEKYDAEISSVRERITDFQTDVDKLNFSRINKLVDGKLFYDDGDGIAEACEIVFADHNGNLSLTIDYEGDGKADLGIVFTNMVFNANSSQNAIPHTDILL